MKLKTKFYKAFIDWDRDRNSEEALANARRALYLIDKKDCEEMEYHTCYKDEYFDSISSDEVKDALYFRLVFRRLLNDLPIHTEHKDNILPLWLVLKYPEILTYNWGRFPFMVAGNSSFINTEEFERLRNSIYRMTEGAWRSASYSHWVGTMWIDLAHDWRNLSQFLSFYPEYILKGSNTVEYNLLPIKAWSSQGLWNKLLYNKFIRDYNSALRRLEKYYTDNKRLSSYAKNAELILSSFVHSYIFDNKIAESKAFLALQNSNKSLNKLKELVHDFEQYDKDELLGRMILEGWSVKAIKWAVKFGANVNAFVFGETAIMKAANNPKMLKALIALGSEVDATNSFGKTALFYAVQFSDLQSVKVLVNAGADVNKALHSYERLKSDFDTGKSYDSVVETVADFTPLVYALRYGSKGVFDFLSAHGGTLGSAPKARIDEWVAEGPTDLKL